MYKSSVFRTISLTLFLFCAIIGFTLQGCDHPSPCETVGCPPNSECVITASGVASCECKPGYVKEGDTCRYVPCSIYECYNDGICYVDSLDVPHCQCPPEYVGIRCERYNECYGNPCGAHGTCELDSLYNARCNCEPGYIGSDCHPDLCIGVVCQYVNTSCNEGVCKCNTGYEGDTCGILIRNKFIGTYNAIDSCVTPPNFVVTITAADSIDQFYINNFYNKGANAKVKAKVTPVINPSSTVLTFNVASQAVGNIIVAGLAQGYINTAQTTINLQYQSSISSSIDSCRVILIKQ